MAFLSFAFKEKPAFSAVMKKQILLFTPALSDARKCYLINETDWETVARPGMKLGMSLYRKRYKKKSRCVRGPQIREDPVVTFNRPLPPWATYPEDIEFQYLYELGPSISNFANDGRSRPSPDPGDPVPPIDNAAASGFALVDWLD